ncbi:cytochrome c biogenesis factor [Bacillus mesophilus]|uniref:Uncharacterized protein n=1 Tax=Bacillus mesophilus TaxID=1808955 RepID=A0A6M0Q3K3_9BACI|nr:hypothetical protein [Bacillus mesophilus]MBM7660260.1 cytochrome c biogenesis factor [Bacillus mesophilus]NEY70975.1 hypothetical protein [Bacillus mesophilus]
MIGVGIYALILAIGYSGTIILFIVEFKNERMMKLRKPMMTLFFMVAMAATFLIHDHM